MFGGINYRVHRSNNALVRLFTADADVTEVTEVTGTRLRLLEHGKIVMVRTSSSMFLLLK